MVGRCLWLWFALALAAVAQDPAPAIEHAATCPKECTPCSEALDKALAWLASKQESDGRFKAGNGAEVATTAVAGLAFMAAGSTDKEGKHSRNVARCRDHLLKAFDDEYTDMYHWNHAFAAIFLSQLGRDKGAIRRLTQKIEQGQLKNGGWGHGTGILRDKLKKAKYPETLTAVTFFCAAALVFAQEAGVKISDSTLKEALQYLEKATVGGAPGYSLDEMSTTRGQAAVRAASILALSRGEPGPWMQSVSKYAVDNFGSVVPSEYDPHPYANYFLAALGLHRRGADAWKRTEAYRDAILKRQAKDGSWPSPQIVDTAYGGPGYFTASCALILALPLEHLPAARLKK